jgi:hypothetical protein
MVEVLFDERQIVRARRVAGLGVVLGAGGHSLKQLFSFLAFIGLQILIFSLVDGRAHYDATFACFGFLISLRPLSFDMIVPSRCRMLLSRISPYSIAPDATITYFYAYVRPLHDAVVHRKLMMICFAG